MNENEETIVEETVTDDPTPTPEPTETILSAVKKDIGTANWDDAFDDQILRDINSVFMILYQMGIGPETPFKATKLTTWDEFTGEYTDIESVKSYVSMRTGLMFDPPSSSIILESKQRICDELGWRLNVQCDPR